MTSPQEPGEGQRPRGASGQPDYVNIFDTPLATNARQGAGSDNAGNNANDAAGQPRDTTGQPHDTAGQQYEGNQPPSGSWQQPNGNGGQNWQQSGPQNSPQGAPYQGFQRGGRHPGGHEFFQWIRQIGLRRGTNRWVGGVCAGVAQRLGWDPLLVRIIWFALCFFGGAGVALYGIAWLLLPDERDGSILVEEATFGHITAGFILSILMIVSGVTSSTATLPFIGIGLIVVIALAIAFISSWNYGNGPRPEGRDHQANAYHAERPAPMNTPTPQGSPAPQQPQQTAQQAAAQQPYQGHQGHQGNQGYQQYPGATTPGSTNQPPTFTSATGANQPPLAQPWTTHPTPPRPAKNFNAYAVRKPAHPAIISIIYAVLFLTAAAITALAFFMPEQLGLSGWQLFILWALVADLIVGISLIGLGIAGRRTGSISWMVAPLLIISLFITPQLGTTTSNFSGRSVSTTVMSSQSYSAQDFPTVSSGVGAVMANVEIDLSDWQNSSASNGTSCPTGPLNLTAVMSNVTITLPSGCSWTTAGLTSVASNIDDYTASDSRLDTKSFNTDETLYIAGSSAFGNLDIEEK